MKKKGKSSNGMHKMPDGHMMSDKEMKKMMIKKRVNKLAREMRGKYA